MPKLGCRNINQINYNIEEIVHTQAKQAYSGMPSIQVCKCPKTTQRFLT